MSGSFLLFFESNDGWITGGPFSGQKWRRDIESDEVLTARPSGTRSSWRTGEQEFRGQYGVVNYSPAVESRFSRIRPFRPTSVTTSVRKTKNGERQSMISGPMGSSRKIHFQSRRNAR